MGLKTTTTNPLAAPEDIVETVEPVKELGCTSCAGWLVITITRHTKKIPFTHNGIAKWDCTLGDMIIDLRESREAPEGDIVMRCKTMERGGPTDENYVGEIHRRDAENYPLFGQMAIRARENYYGISRHDGGLYKTYNYRGMDNIGKPMPGIMIYGRGPGSMDRRGAVLIHWAQTHYPIIGCIGLYNGDETEVEITGDSPDWKTQNAVGSRAIRVDANISWDTITGFMNIIEQFLGTRIPSSKCRNVALEIKEEY